MWPVAGEGPGAAVVAELDAPVVPKPLPEPPLVVAALAPGEGPGAAVVAPGAAVVAELDAPVVTKSPLVVAAGQVVS